MMFQRHIKGICFLSQHLAYTRLITTIAEMKVLMAPATLPTTLENTKRLADLKIRKDNDNKQQHSIKDALSGWATKQLG
jgi:hypothetical protein